MGLTQNEDLAPSPLAGEGWGEGEAASAKTKACANVTTLSPCLTLASPIKGESEARVKTANLRKS